MVGAEQVGGVRRLSVIISTSENTQLVTPAAPLCVSYTSSSSWTLIL